MRTVRPSLLRATAQSFVRLVSDTFERRFGVSFSALTSRLAFLPLVMVVFDELPMNSLLDSFHSTPPLEPAANAMASGISASATTSPARISVRILLHHSLRSR